MDIGLLIIIAVLAAATLPAIFFKYKFKIDTYGPFCLWKTKKGLRLLDKWARRKRFWIALSDLGIIFAFGLFGAGYLILDGKDRKKAVAGAIAGYLIFVIAALIVALPGALIKSIPLPPELVLPLLLGGFGFFVVAAFIQQTVVIVSNYFMGVIPTPGIMPVLPGVEIPGAPLYIPLEALVGLVALVIVHEFGHGIVSRVQKVNVKSLGILTAGVIPLGAFTEPDEKQLKRVSPRKRLRVFSVGSMTNFMLGFIILIIFIPLQAVMLPGMQAEVLDSTDYIIAGQVVQGSPAYAAGIVEGTEIYNVQDVFTNQEPGVGLVLDTSMGVITLNRDARGMIGLATYDMHFSSELSMNYWIQRYFLSILSWTVALNFLVGVINLMPFAIFDGARIFEDVLATYLKKLGLKDGKVASRTTFVLTAFILLLIFINAMPYFIKAF